ncbi:MAG: RNA 2',3'-cyclic phosphodiesterase [Candidatus Bathyarchaeia archaeon]
MSTVLKLVRSFIAIDLTVEDAVKRIAEAQAALKACGADLKLVEPENLHFTLKFLGELSSKEVEDVKEALGEVVFKPFKITLENVGFFPNANYIRVVWVGVSEGVEALQKVAAEVERRIVEKGFPRDERGFSPHLTIARVKPSRAREGLLRTVEAWRGRVFGSQEVWEVKLKKSDLTPSGPVYTDLYVRKAQP